MFKFSALLSLVLLATSAAAQAPIYGQCGGQGWTGATTCASGSTCVVSNPYYSQCLPGSSSGGGSGSGTTTTTTTSVGGSSPTTTSAPASTATPAAGNPYTGFSVFPSQFYAAEVKAAAAQISDATTAAKALTVANIPSFTWFDQIAKVPQLGWLLGNATALQNSSGQKQIVQIIVYDLPDRDCAAAASNGEFSYANNGAANYQSYIDGLVGQIKQFPNVRVVAIIEPDSLANLVTNLSVAKCANAQSGYLASVNYALKQLASVGVYMYIDAGHAGWLGWPANLSPAAQLFTQVWTNAGKSSFIRGLATDVANYNALSAASPDPITQGNSNYDESHYINALAPVLRSNGWSAQFIVDQGRSGVQNIRQQWGDWCNVKGAGFGLRPTTNTGNSYIDAIVWAKPGGECDGTSNTSSTRYDYHCGLSDALQPAPEAGSWFQNYFVQLVQNASPSL